jgi:heavy metal sensor kinase
MMARLPLRMRLTLWYSLGFAAAFFAIGFAGIWMVHRAILELENNELRQRVRSVERFLDARPAGETQQQTHEAITAAYDVTHGSKWLQVIDEHGVWLYRSPHVADVYPTLTLPQQLTEPAQYFDFTSAPSHVRALIAPIRAHGMRYSVQTGLTLNKSLAILSNVQAQLLGLAALGLVILSLGGYFMSRKALSPITLLAAEAQRINDRNLNLRMPELRSRDELAALSATLNQMLERIDAGYQSVRSFTANAAHELRTPVALLQAETEVALAFPRDAAYYRRVCEDVQGSAKQMSRLIDQLLSLARSDAGVETLRFEPVHLQDLAEETAAAWAELFAAAGIELQVQVDVPMCVQADYAAMRRLMHVLLENAWRYTPEGGAVTIAATARDDAAELEVRDNGIGIAPDRQARIFERFYRAAPALRGDFAGSGLGLVLAQGIAERHGTRICVRSEPGKGSRFWICLPLVRDAGSTMASGSPAGRAPDRV